LKSNFNKGDFITDNVLINFQLGWSHYQLSAVPYWSMSWRHRSSSTLIGQSSHSYQMPLIRSSFSK